MKNTLLLMFLVMIISGMIIPGTAEKNKPKNLQVLDFKTVPETKVFMKTVAKSLGVKCKFCHNLDDFSLDTDHKKTARYMMKMTKKINEDFFTWEGARKISCKTCHQGHEEPPKE